MTTPTTRLMTLTTNTVNDMIGAPADDAVGVTLTCCAGDDAERVRRWRQRATTEQVNRHW
jgi:hypothetical protein